MPSLYRKYRPQKFSDLVGEDHIRDTLLVAIKENRLSHAYLFSGPRGTGKTTVARLIAKAVNCQNLNKKNDGEPCNQCDSCTQIAAGKNLDMIEIDAASNRGIDEIRELRDKVKYAPTKSKYKVYIIDEVHMLTLPAFNALLKTLEEPPSHAIFVLATTDPQKIPATILSRVIRFDFRRIKKEQIAENLKMISKSENILADDEIFEQLAILADGSHRDGISIFEQVASSGKKITKELLSSALGLSKESETIGIISSLIDDKPDLAIAGLSDLLSSGISAEHINKLIIEVLRRTLLCKISDQLAERELTREQIESIENVAKNISAKKINQILSVFILAQGMFKETSIRSLPIEMAIIESSKILSDGKNIVVAEEIIEIKPDIEKNEKIGDKKLADKNNQISKKEIVRNDVSTNLELTEINKDDWQKILTEIKNHNHSLQALLRDTYPKGINGDSLVLGVKFKFHADKISEQKNCQILESVVSGVLGGKIRIKCLVESKKPAVVNKNRSDNDDLEKVAEEMFEVE